MIDPLDPLLTFYQEHPDHNQGDSLAETKRLFERQQAIDKLLHGTITPDELLDLIDSHGMDAAHYADCAVSNLNKVVDQQLIIDPYEAAFYGLV